MDRKDVTFCHVIRFCTIRDSALSSSSSESDKLLLKCYDGKTVIDQLRHLQFVPSPPHYHPQSTPPRVHPSPSGVRRTSRRPHSRAAINASETEASFC